MDFLQFLQSSASTDHTRPQIHTETPLTIDLCRGNMVKIIRKQNSSLNYYKGYVGEIKEYKQGRDKALVFLHAINSYTRIWFPIDHFYVLK